MRPTWVLSAPCWPLCRPHEPCYLGCSLGYYPYCCIFVLRHFFSETTTVAKISTHGAILFILRKSVLFILLKSVLCNIPKDLTGDLCNSDNYIGIALCSALCKAVDILMIERYEHILFTSGMQFAYERHHSTNMCTKMIKEMASNYNSRHTDVFLCTLDASKAFDRVHLGKLFALLHNRGLPPVADRL